MKNYLASWKKNKGLKLTALLLAIAAWLAVGSEERTEASIQFGLELVNIPKELLITNEIPTYIEAQVQGPRSAIRELANDRLHKQIDLARAAPGTLTVPLSPASLNLPRGVIATRIRPSSLTITLDEALTKKLPVQPIIQGSPAPGFEVGEVKITPQEVLLTGPKKVMQQLKVINTVPVDIQNLTSSVSKNVDLDFQNQALTYKDPQPLVAKINIRPKTQVKVFSSVPVKASPALKGVTLTPAKVSVALRGPATNLEVLRPEEVQVTVALRNLAPGRYRLPVEVAVPAGVEIQQVSPAAVQVSIAKGRSG